MKKPEFKGNGFCKECGDKRPLASSGMCESCWTTHKKAQRKEAKKRRITNEYTKGWSDCENRFYNGAQNGMTILEVITLIRKEEETEDEE